mmetsp:Transcript_39917/g.126955  ORF Transcript_39917/g.126955 Transcript_39917/m.126955 type:complete len:200 (-) Transcript_39917:348-947(-)
MFMAAASAAVCPPAPRLRPAAPPADVPFFPLLDDMEEIDGLQGLEELSAPVAPCAPKLGPAASPFEISELPAFELPPAAVDAELLPEGELLPEPLWLSETASSEEEEEPVVFKLDGFSDDEAFDTDRSDSEWLATPRILEPLCLDSHCTDGKMHHVTAAALHSDIASCALSPVRVHSLCSTRASTPQRQVSPPQASILA